MGMAPPAIGNDHASQFAYVEAGFKNVWRPVGMAIKRCQRDKIPIAIDETLFPPLDAFFTWLDTDVKMTPELAKAAKIEGRLRNTYEGDSPYPEPYATQARMLHDRWSAVAWGGLNRIDGPYHRLSIEFNPRTKNVEIPHDDHLI